MEFEKSIYSIGHSSHTMDEFLELLNSHHINAIVDVRSSPYSNRYPQFSKSIFKNSLATSKIKYVFLGKELGGRPEIPEHFEFGIANYEEMVKSRSYDNGIRRVLNGAQKYKIALMCSEHNPLECHRCLMVSRTFSEMDIETNHILKNGNIKTHTTIEKHLLENHGKETLDFFASPTETLSAAYKKQAMKVAYNETDNLIKRAL